MIFRKSFSVKPACLAATENRISRKWFQFDRNFTHLTRKWFYIFILPSNHFRVTRKREREREKKREREKERRARRDRPKLRLPRSFAEIVHRDCEALGSHKALIVIAIAITRSTAPITITRSTAPIAILPSRRSRSHEVSGFDDFFLGFVCVSVLRNEWYYIFVWQPRKCEKIWATSRKCVFYGIFKNTTKHRKIFFETFFEMQPNT